MRWIALKRLGQSFDRAISSGTATWSPNAAVLAYSLTGLGLSYLAPQAGKTRSFPWRGP